MATFTGNTVEEAIERGLRRLNVKRENVHVEIEQRDSNGILGFGKKRARVNIEPIHEETVRRADREATRGVDQTDMEIEKAESAMEAALRNREKTKLQRTMEIRPLSDEDLSEAEEIEEMATRSGRLKKNEKFSKNMTTMPESEEIESPQKSENVGTSQSNPQSLTEAELALVTKVSAYVTEITALLGVPARVTPKKKNGSIVLNMTSDHDALLIGKHGKILQALEVVARTYASTLSDSRSHLRLNIAAYNEKRERYLINLAKKAAQRAKGGETVYISDLRASERKVIHDAISSINGVSSHSEGKDMGRYIVVSQDIRLT